MFITSPKAFAEWSNEKYPGTSCRITPEDVNDMTACGIIHRYGYYSVSMDGETVRGVLQYEQLRQKRMKKQTAEDKSEPQKCKRCGQPLTYQQEARKGRRREYCQQCESSRVKERYQKWRRKRQVALC
jgi:hypothetical protein